MTPVDGKTWGKLQCHNKSGDRENDEQSEAYKGDGKSMEVKGHMCQMKEFRFYYGECGRPMGHTKRGT